MLILEHDVLEVILLSFMDHLNPAINGRFGILLIDKNLSLIMTVLILKELFTKRKCVFQRTDILNDLVYYKLTNRVSLYRIIIIRSWVQTCIFSGFLATAFVVYITAKI